MINFCIYIFFSAHSSLDDNVLLLIKSCHFVWAWTLVDERKIKSSLLWQIKNFIIFENWFCGQGFLVVMNSGREKSQLLHWTAQVVIGLLKKKNKTRLILLNGVIAYPLSTMTQLRASLMIPIQLTVRSECYLSFYLFIIQPWSLATMCGFNTPYHLKSHNSICIIIDTGSICTCVYNMTNSTDPTYYGISDTQLGRVMPKLVFYLRTNIDIMGPTITLWDW